MEAFLAPSRPVNQYFGVYTAIVIDNVDPEERYRVKVKYPWLMESDAKYVDVTDKADMPSTWCRIAATLAGTNKHEGTKADELRGHFFLPEKDDEVLVTFLYGDFREPIIIGQLYNGKDLPFWSNKGASGVARPEENDLRGIRSRNGHMLAFCDNPEKEKIVLQCKVKDDNVYDQPALGNTTTVEKALCSTIDVDTPDGAIGTHVISLDMESGKEHILISDKDGKLLLKMDSVEQTMCIYSEKDMVLHAKKNMHIKCETLKVESTKDTEMEAGTTWKQKSGTTMDLEAGGTMTCKGGPDIQLNP